MIQGTLEEIKRMNKRQVSQYRELSEILGGLSRIFVVAVEYFHFKASTTEQSKCSRTVYNLHEEFVQFIIDRSGAR